MKTNYLTLLGSSILATGILLSLSATKSNAFTLTNDPSCAAAATAFLPQYDDCRGSYLLGGGENDVTDGGADNIVTKLLNEDDIFGTADWTFGAKEDGGTQGISDLFELDGLNSTSGIITLNTTKVANILGGDFEDYDLAISFKSAKNFSIYQWDAPLGGTTPALNVIEWSTAGTATNNKDKAQALSHASLYVRKVSDDPVAQNPMDIPEPGTILSLGLLAVGTAVTTRKIK